MQEQKHLSDLAVGDEVAIQAGMSRDYSVYPIREISAKGIITISTGNKYRPDGTPLAKGEKWHRPNPIEPVTDEIRAAMRKKRLVSRMSGLNYNHWQAMDLEKLEAINAVVWGEE